MTQSVRAGFIVEGHGDVKAVPVVFGRIVRLHFPGLQVIPQNPFRVPRDKLLKQGELERTVEFVSRGLENRRVILVLIDSDDDCPALLGPALLDRARRARGDVPIGVALAKCEFENWFIAAASSLAGKRNLPADLASPPSPALLGLPAEPAITSKPLINYGPNAAGCNLPGYQAVPATQTLCRGK
jgi:hypothetical protein